MFVPFDQIGGRESVERLAERFYDVMEATEPLLVALHDQDSPGKISRRSRDRFAMFLVGWLGGPQDYTAQNGHPRLRMRHARVRVDVSMRDAWLRCMTQAMQLENIPPELRAFLEQRFAEVADFMRNVEE